MSRHPSLPQGPGYKPGTEAPLEPIIGWRADIDVARTRREMADPNTPENLHLAEQWERRWNARAPGMTDHENYIVPLQFTRAQAKALSFACSNALAEPANFEHGTGHERMTGPMERAASMIDYALAKAGKP